MTPDIEEMLSSLIDGASVDPDRLALALADPEASTAIVEFARIRAIVQADDIRPDDAFYRSASARLRTGRTRRFVASRMPLAAAAALVVCATVTGLWLGRLSAQRRPLAPEAVAYCTDARGIAHAPGWIAAIDDRRVQCVLRGEWKVLAQ